MKEAIKYGYFAFEEMLDFGNRYEEYELCGRYARLHPEAGRKAVGQGDEEEVLCKPHSKRDRQSGVQPPFRRAESPFEERQCNRGAGHEMDRRAVSGQFSHPCLCAVSDQAGTGEDRL